MSISEKLTELASIRTSMREKLAAKGIDASTHNFADFPEDIENIPSGGSDDEYCSNAKGLFIPIYINVTLSCEGVDL